MHLPPPSARVPAPPTPAPRTHPPRLQVMSVFAMWEKGLQECRLQPGEVAALRRLLEGLPVVPTTRDQWVSIKVG